MTEAHHLRGATPTQNPSTLCQMWPKLFVSFDLFVMTFSVTILPTPIVQRETWGKKKKEKEKISVAVAMLSLLGSVTLSSIC